jgi:hypothetical protein
MKMIQDSLYYGRDLNRGPIAYATGLPAALPLRLLAPVFRYRVRFALLVPSPSDAARLLTVSRYTGRAAGRDSLNQKVRVFL